GDAVKLPIGALAAGRELDPQLVPSLRDLRHALGIPHGARQSPSCSTRRGHGSVVPYNLPPCRGIRNSLDTRFPAKPGIREWHDDHLASAFAAQKRNFELAQQARIVAVQLSSPGATGEQYRSTNPYTRLNDQPQALERPAALAAADRCRR